MSDERLRIKTFMETAKYFCDLCERAEEIGPETFFVELAHTLPRLQAAGALLPYPEETVVDHPIFTAEDSLKIRLPSAAVRFVREVDWTPIQEKLYEYIVDGHRSDAATSTTIYEDLDEIYNDVKEGFEILRAGYPLAEAVWEWNFSFWSHWAFHVAEVQRVIQKYAADYLARPDERAGRYFEPPDVPDRS